MSMSIARALMYLIVDSVVVKGTID